MKNKKIIISATAVVAVIAVLAIILSRHSAAETAAIEAGNSSNVQMTVPQISASALDDFENTEPEENTEYENIDGQHMEENTDGASRRQRALQNSPRPSDKPVIIEVPEEQSISPTTSPTPTPIPTEKTEGGTESVDEIGRISFFAGEPK